MNTETEICKLLDAREKLASDQVAISLNFASD